MKTKVKRKKSKRKRIFNFEPLELFEPSSTSAKNSAFSFLCGENRWSIAVDRWPGIANSCWLIAYS